MRTKFQGGDDSPIFYVSKFGRFKKLFAMITSLSELDLRNSRYTMLLK